MDKILRHQQKITFKSESDAMNPPLPRLNVELACVVQDFGHSRHTGRGIPFSFNIKMGARGHTRFHVAFVAGFLLPTVVVIVDVVL